MFDEIFIRITKTQNFPDGYDWINVKEPLSLEKLKSDNSIGFLDILLHKLYAYASCISSIREKIRR
jgi:hypothetical protein